MNELLKLLVKNGIGMKAEVQDGKVICVFTDISDSSDSEPIYCSVQVQAADEEEGFTFDKFREIFARPAIISIKCARQRKRIEAIRTEAEQIQEICDADNDLSVYSKVMERLLVTIDSFCSTFKDD